MAYQNWKAHRSGALRPGYPRATRAKIAIKYNLHRMADDSVDILRRLHEERKAALAICHEESPHAKLASFLSVTSTT